MLIDHLLFLNFEVSLYFLLSLLSLTEVKINWQKMEHPDKVTAAAAASATLPSFKAFQ